MDASPPPAHRSAQVFALLAMAMGMLGLFGWVVDIDRSRVLVEGFPPMSVNSALSLLICGIGLYGHARSGSAARRWGGLSDALLVLVALTALLTLLEYAVGARWDVLRVPMAWLARRPQLLISSPHTAFVVLLLSIGLLAHARAPAGMATTLVQALVAIVFCALLVVLVGYLFSNPLLFGIEPNIGMAIHSWLGLSCLAIGLFNLRPDRGLAKLVYGGGLGSHLLRVYLPVIGASLLLFMLLANWATHLHLSYPQAVLFVLSLLTVTLVLGVAAWRMNREERERQLLSARYRELFDANPDGILVTDAEGRILQVNTQLEALSGYTRAELIGEKVEMLVPARARARHATIREAYQRHPSPRAMVNDLDIAMLCRDGGECPVTIAIRPVREGVSGSYILSIRDMREHKAIEQRLADLTHVSGHDPLTGLPNRRLLEELLDQMLATARRNEKSIVLCYCDLDGFKEVNDQNGHLIGDALLVEVAKRMTQCVREQDVVSRIGGDEFVVALADITWPEDVLPIAHKLIERVAEPYSLEGKMLRVTLSVGISHYPKHGATPEALIKLADAALYIAKSRGKNQFHIVDTA